MSDNLLDVREASFYLNLSPATLRKWIFERRVVFVKLGGRVLFRQQDLDEFVRASLVQPRHRSHDGEEKIG